MTCSRCRRPPAPWTSRWMRRCNWWKKASSRRLAAPTAAFMCDARTSTRTGKRRPSDLGASLVKPAIDDGSGDGSRRPRTTLVNWSYWQALLHLPDRLLLLNRPYGECLNSRIAEVRIVGPDRLGRPGVFRGGTRPGSPAGSDAAVASRDLK